MQRWFSTVVAEITIELPDGSKELGSLEAFDEKYDIALLKLTNENHAKHVKYCDIDFNASVRLGDAVFFGGFPSCVTYNHWETPFAINTGIVSSLPEMIVTGDRYPHIQINSINLGGNSGAPLFRRGTNTVVGIINGNMNWGRDDIAVFNSNKSIVESGLRVPLGIAYATSMKLLRENSAIFQAVFASQSSESSAVQAPVPQAPR